MLNTISNQQLRQPVTLTEGEAFSDQSLISWQEPFVLTESDFLRLQSRSTRLEMWGTIVLSGTVGYGLGLLPALLAFVTSQSKEIEVSSSQTLTLCLGLVLAGLLFGGSRCWPSDRTQVMNRIRDHFKRSQPNHTIMRKP